MEETNSRSFEKVAKGSFYLVLDNITNLSLGAIFWIVLAKIIEPSSLGQAMVVNAFAMSIIGFAGFGVQVTISKYMSEYNMKEMYRTSRRIFTLGIKLALLVSGSVGIAIALLSGFISEVAYQNPSLGFLLAFTVLTFLPSQTVVSALMGVYQGAQKMKYALITDLIYQIIRIVIAIILVLYGWSSFGILAAFSVASIIASIIGFTFFVRKILRMNRIANNNVGDNVSNKDQDDLTGGLGHVLKFSAHNYFAMGMRTLTAQIGVLIVGTQDFELAAFYGLSVLISNLVGGILMAVSRAILPTATEEWIKGNKEGFKSTLNASIRLSLMVSGFGFIILMVDPSTILGLISEAYVEASSALRMLVVASIIASLGAIITSMLNAANRASDVSRVGLASSTTTIALTFILTPILGIEGAAYAVLAGAIVSLGCSLVYFRLREGMSISSRSTVKPSISIIVGLASAALLTYIMQSTLVALAASLVIYCSFSLASRVITKKELRMLLAIVQTKKS